MKSNFFILLLVLSLGSVASVLPKKTKMIRVGTIVSESQGLWIADKFTDFGGDTTRNATSYTLLYGVGLGKGWQLDLNTIYTKTELNGGDFSGANVSEGDSQSGLSSIGFSAKKRLSKKRSKNSFVAEFGFVAAGSSNSFESEEMFLAVNDGSTRIHAGINYGLKLSKMLSLDSQLKYIHRIEARKPDILTANLGLNFAFKKFGFIPFMNYLQTFGGVNIAGTDFANRSNSIGQGRLVFSQKREEIVGFGLNSYFVASPGLVVDAFYQFTSDGENTDKAKNFGLGLSKFF